MALRARLVLTYWPFVTFLQFGRSFDLSWKFSMFDLWWTWVTSDAQNGCIQSSVQFPSIWWVIWPILKIFDFWHLVTRGNLGWPRVVPKVVAFDSLSLTAYMSLFSWVLVDFKHASLFSGPRGRNRARMGILRQFALGLFIISLQPKFHPPRILVSFWKYNGGIKIVSRENYL